MGCEMLVCQSNEPVKSKFHCLAWLDMQDLDLRITEDRSELSERTIDHGESPKVNWDDLLGSDQFAHRIGGALGVHREVSTNANKRQTRLEERVDQRHVAECVRVASVIDLNIVLQLNNISDSLASTAVLNVFRIGPKVS